MKKQWLKPFALIILLTGLLLTLQPVFAAGGGSGTISLPTLGSPYTQDFNTLANSGTTNVLAINGWFLDEGTVVATANNGQYAGGTGSGTGGDTYSFGAAAATERAFGGLLSGSVTPTIGASFTNNTGVTITKLDIAYTGEMWRAGVLNRNAADRLDFQLSTDATSLTSVSTWVDYDSLDFSSPVINTTAGALDGNLAANQTALSFSITGLSIPNDGVFWIRWNDFNIASSDDGLAVDTFSLTPNVDGPADPVINEFSASTTSTDVEYLEFYGTPDTDYSAYTLLGIEGDSGSGEGVIDNVVPLGTTDANGFYYVSLAANTLENGTLSLLLVEGFSGAVTDDLDSDNDGTLDSSPWTTLIDAVAVNDGGAGDRAYGGTVLTVAYDGLAFAPGGASRIPDGQDTDTTADWVRNDFDLAGIPPNTGTPVAGEAYNTPNATNQAVPTGDVPPTVSTTSPADNATNVALDSDITITFSEAVTVTDPWFTISCASSGSHTAVQSGGPTSFTLNPGVNFSFNEVCTVTVTAANVADQDGTPDNMAADYVFDFTTATPPTIVKIHDIQGNGSAVTGAGPFTVEAIVVGDYQTQGSGQLRGFFIQEEDADVDADPATSEGIFVFCSGCPVVVAVGDKVQVTGSASEFFNMSQLTASTVGTVSVLSSSNPLPTAAIVELPVPGVPTGDLTAATTAINAYFEPFEGMLVKFPDTLSVSEYFELARYGQIILNEGGRPRTFTDANTPTALGYTNHRIDLASRSIILDDTDNRENRPVDTPNTNYYHPVPGLSITNFFRGGDTITDLTGVLHWSFNGTTGEDAWRIRPVVEEYDYEFTSVNPRPEVPTITGTLTVASFNVLNYFLSIDTSNTCSPTLTADCRGADSAQELERQHDKMMAALTEISADVFGFMEMENTPGVEPLAAIVADLPGYDYIDTGVIGTDAIRVGIIYDTATVEPVGDYAVISQAEFPGFNTSRNRPALAQTFEEIATGERFTVVVNHLKSKGSDCGGGGDDDTTTGQGNCNGTRTAAAEAMADWLATDPTDSEDPDFLIIGDLNSYAKEDPIVALEDAGYTNLVALFGGASAYGYVFDGQLGYLDHALSNESLTPQVTGVAEWHINADEIPLFDYNDDVRTADEATFEEESDTQTLYEPNEFRTSDHDPVLIGLTLDTAEPDTTITIAPTDPSGADGGIFEYESSEGGDQFECELDGDGDDWFDCDDGQYIFNGLTDGPHTFKVRAIDGAGNVDPTPAEHTWTIDTGFPAVTINQASGQSDPTSSSPIHFTVVFTETVTGFQTGDVTLGGTAGATTAIVTEIAPNDGTTYDVAVSGMTTSGTVIASVPAEVAEDAVTLPNTASTSTDNTVTYNAPVVDEDSIFVSTTAAGTVGPLSYGSEDVLEWDGSAWSVWFDGSAAGLTASGAKHNLNSIYIPDPDGADLYVSFTQNARVVPGIGPKVDGMDIVHWDGSAFTLWFDGQDVGLTNKTQEKIDSLHVLDGAESPIGGSCAAYLLISMQGPGKVPNYSGGTLKFSGEDVLGFCATNLGDATAGLWHMVLDGSAEGMPKNSTDSISLSEDGNTLYLTTKGAFNVDSATGGHSMVYRYDFGSGEFSGPFFTATATGLTGKVDGLHVEGDLP